ncbi:MAG: energy-coupling factor transporter transmembrane protein EcfT [Treponema sp.]|jgi:cobalt/nickel transport system permease protein|nr:energy-coupling factor transporter transmembrane protein EcfT [Treponema sp.]
MLLNRLELKNDILKNTDARCRLTAAFVFTLAAIHLGNIVLLICLDLFLFLTPVLFRLQPAPLIRNFRIVLFRLFQVNIFCVLLFITMPLGGEKIGKAVVYTLRINASALAYMFFIIPMGIGKTASALLKLKVPAKLVSLFVLTYRCLFIMHQRVFRAILSMRLRRPRMGTLTAWRSYTAAFAYALAGAAFRSKRIAAAMRARGFDGALPVTAVFKWKLTDTLFLAAVVIFSFLILLADKKIPWNI